MWLFCHAISNALPPSTILPNPNSNNQVSSFFYLGEFRRTARARRWPMVGLVARRYRGCGRRRRGEGSSAAGGEELYRLPDRRSQRFPPRLLPESAATGRLRDGLQRGRRRGRERRRFGAMAIWAVATAIFRRLVLRRGGRSRAVRKMNGWLVVSRALHHEVLYFTSSGGSDVIFFTYGPPVGATFFLLSKIQ